MAALQAQNHKLGRLQGTERRCPQARGDAVETTGRRGDRAGGWAAMCCATRSQTVHPEGVLGGRVGQDHIWVIEHVQSIQGQGVNLEFVQGELVVRVEADITDPGQRAGQFFREAGRGLSCHWGGGYTQKAQLRPGPRHPHSPVDARAAPGSSPERSVLQRTFAVSGDSFSCHYWRECYWCQGGGQGCCDAALHPTAHRMEPTHVSGCQGQEALG